MPHPRSDEVRQKAHPHGQTQSIRGPIEERQDHGPQVVLLPRLEIEGDHATPQGKEDTDRPPGAQRTAHRDGT